MQGVIGTFRELDAAVHAVEELKKQNVGDVTVYTPAVSDGRAYVVRSDGVVEALDAASGAVQWSVGTPRPVDAMVHGTHEAAIRRNLEKNVVAAVLH